ncbi:MAG: type I-E CRISPR-associated protein Cas7/Cse4/CasC, partial [Chloroflexi bacterium]|nr:type I-E CRISPR-associated protein Cas7/Cse4/CasC [Chloroflexota bacterium]
TAVDDLLPSEETGADMLGTVEFNSACFYRYANVDLDQLARNLGGDTELAGATLEAYLRAAVSAVPTGKQNSMAAQNPPSFVFAVAREAGLWSLANAFAKPVWVGQSGDLVQQSIARLDEYWGRLTRMYGQGGIAGTWVCGLEDDGLAHLKGAKVDSIEELVQGVAKAVKFDGDGDGRKQ